MRIIRATLPMLLLSAGAFAQPVITQNLVLNGASYVPLGLPNGNIAQGSIFSIFGQNLSPVASRSVMRAFR